MTDPDQTRHQTVTDKQSIAIESLLGGNTHREAAEAAGVQRSTVTTWVNHSPEFIAELNRRRSARLSAWGDFLHQVTGKGLQLLADRVEDGDVDAALALLRLVGLNHLLTASEPGPTTALAVRMAAPVGVKMIESDPDFET